MLSGSDGSELTQGEARGEPTVGEREPLGLPLHAHADPVALHPELPQGAAPVAHHCADSFFRGDASPWTPRVQGFDPILVLLLRQINLLLVPTLGAEDL